MNSEIIRTNAAHQDFITLVKELDAYLKITDKDEHDFYNQFNNIDVIKHVVILYVNKVAVGCGAIKKFDNSTMEIKRMYVSNDYRSIGLAQKLIAELETWTKELGLSKCILETGKRQKAAVKFYEKCNYNVIENYGQYVGMKNSICFEKNV
ncbi:GNAT family N-acetyltransferase [uncultured Polaribacter sp.]|uniref:GNAT family N-acetyltransferase n=1 Tax=uncultured Polaribacter sp. TaxID=174711 RepID=UPI002602044D|nr:GNAT family N-acetyltransferase [uncultured Polaribacter sp.]